MDKAIPLEECSINQIYLESQEPKTYVIPVYQRNYAWEEDEISALIKDVHDSFRKDKRTSYYIGTLVTYKRGDSEYEVIDGQQRLTTIYIILKVLGIKNFRNKLTYSARKVSASTIEKLDSFPDLGEAVDQGIRNGYKFAENAIREKVSEEEREEFTRYFLHEVHLIHYLVPKDVDLNHYFEVMNSRGEQLEKQEIVKSLLGQNLGDEELLTFSRIWEACSEMNIYIQQVFPSNEVFGPDLSGFMVHSFNEIPQQGKQKEKGEIQGGKDTILNLLSRAVEKEKEDSSIEQTDRFQPIIDFPNFLLIVLKLTRMGYEKFNPVGFALDDKELLNEFTKALEAAEDKTKFTRSFTFNLLKSKYLLDNYVVHHALSDKELSGDNPWKLQYYYQETSKKKYPKNIAGMTEVQKELVHLLSMFEVSFTPKQRKNYLFYCLMYLFDNMGDTEGYLDFLRWLADKYFFDVYLNKECLNERNMPRPNAFDNVLLKNRRLQFEEVGMDGIDYKAVFNEIYSPGRSDIPLFVFNYTDYKIWSMYSDALRGNRTKKGSGERKEFFDALGCSDFELDPFNNFYFSRTRKSLEHYYPQAKAVKDEEASECALGVSQINCFGNFAMIGSEANSSGSNWDPKAKLEHYADGKSDPISVASLKFRIMLQTCRDNYKSMLNGVLDRPKGMEWNYSDIQRHQEKMLDIIIG